MEKKIGRTRAKIAEFFYNKILSESKGINKYEFSLSKVKSIAVIFDEKTGDLSFLINHLQEYYRSRLKPVSIYKLAYNLGEFNIPSDGIPVMHLKDKNTNFYGEPLKGEIESFTENEFDLLINLSQSDTWPLRFTLAKSKAKFKISCKESAYIQYDLLMPFGKNDNWQKHFSFILNILGKINNSEK